MVSFFSPLDHSLSIAIFIKFMLSTHFKILSAMRTEVGLSLVFLPAIKAGGRDRFGHRLSRFRNRPCFLLPGNEVQGKENDPGQENQNGPKEASLDTVSPLLGIKINPKGGSQTDDWKEKMHFTTLTNLLTADNGSPKGNRISFHRKLGKEDKGQDQKNPQDDKNQGPPQAGGGMDRFPLGNDRGNGRRRGIT